MREDDARQLIAEQLEAATAARKAGAPKERLSALETAFEAARDLADASLLQICGWRLAKARFDEHRNATLLDSLEPLMDITHERQGVFRVKTAITPFSHYPAGLRALHPITRRVWDTEGYQHEGLDRLWLQWIAHHEAEEHPFMMQWGHLQRAWQFAVRGDLDALKPVVHQALKLDGHAFDRAPHLHPNAATPEASVFHLQLDFARTWLRAATWAGQERVAWEAAEALLDAVADLASERVMDFWALDALFDAAQSFQWERSDLPSRERFEAACATLESGSAHQLRAQALLSRDPSLALDSAEAAAAQADGFEWVDRALSLAQRFGAQDPTLSDRRAALRRDHGVGICLS